MESINNVCACCAQKDETKLIYNDTVFKEINTNIRSFMQTNNIDFIICGSCALVKLGINIDRDINDIDIIVKCDKKQEQLFKSMSDCQKNYFYREEEKYLNCEHKPYIFMFNGFKINVWCYETLPNIYAVVDNIKYLTIDEVLKTKMRYRRQKDLRDLISISQKILNYGNSLTII